MECRRCKQDFDATRIRSVHHVPTCLDCWFKCGVKVLRETAKGFVAETTRGDFWYVEKKRAKRRPLTQITCQLCGKLHLTMTTRAPKFCSVACSLATNRKRGKDHPYWKGGRTSSGNGYAVVANDDGAYQLEHRAVMESMLGRRLASHETVHHKNGIRNDNRPENLELWSGRHPSGARVIDQVRWARQLLEEYGDLFPEDAEYGMTRALPVFCR